MSNLFVEGDQVETGGPDQNDFVFEENVLVNDRDESTIAFIEGIGIGGESLPVVEHLFAGDEDQNSYKYDENDGTELWQSSPGEFFNPPEVTEQAMYIESGYDLYALDITDGSTLWSFTFDRYASSTPLVKNGVLYGATNSYVYAVDIDTRTLLWKSAGTGAYNSKAIDGDTLYVGDGSGFVRAIDTADGSDIWTYDIGSFSATSPSVIDGVVYCAGKEGFVAALTASDGTEIWRKGGFDTVYNPSVVGETLFHGTDGSGIYARDISDGSVKWSTSLSGDFHGQNGPAVYDGVVYVGRDLSKVSALDTADGTKLWTTTIPNNNDGRIATTLVVHDGLVYAGNDDFSTSKMVALDTADGSIVWDVDLSNGALGITRAGADWTWTQRPGRL